MQAEPTHALTAPDPTAGLPRPPGPGLLRTWLFAPRLLSFAPQLLHDLRDRYGDVTLIRLGPERLVLVQDPELIHALLVTHADELHKDEVTHSLRTFLGEGLLTSEVPLWRQQRKRIAPQFKRSQLAVYANTMTALTRQYAAKWQDGQVLDLHAAMMELTLDIVLQTVLGGGLGELAGDVGHALDDVMLAFDAEQRSVRRLFARWLKPRLDPRMAAAIVVLDRAGERLISEARADLAAGKERHDLLTRLLEAKGDDGEPMDDRQVRDEVLTLLTAGHETTALALTWTLLHLADHPEVLAQLRSELQTQLDDRAAGVADLGSLPYTKAVLLESMRLHPPAFIIGRQPLRPMALGGYRLKPGDQLLMAQWSMHRDARHFAEPERFWPERWLDGLEERLPRGVYFPFGGGPRVCIGQHFAMMEAMLCLVALVQQVQLVRTTPGWPGYVPSITLRPKGAIPMKVRRVRGE